MQQLTLNFHQFKAVFIVQPSFNGALASDPAAIMQGKCGPRLHLFARFFLQESLNNFPVLQPSFNGALASDPAAIMPEAGGGQRQFFCVMNTILALLGAAIAAFASSAAFTGKLNMVHIQNATLAGGVAIGSAANLSFSPAGAVAVGVVAGILSTLGFR